MPGAQRMPLRHALALGLLHGPTELLPVSSSAHTTLVPWLAGWSYGELDPRLRKSFEVALHAGTAAALLVRAPRERSAEGGREGDSAGATADSGSAVAKLGFLAAAAVPPALAGYALGTQIERRLGTPATIAAGLLAGSAATGVGELRKDDARAIESARGRDGLALGLAQALALIPGVSRSGATIATARARGFSRGDADRLSWRVGLPVIAGAAALKGSRLACEGVPRELGLSLVVGAASAFASTLASTRALSPKRRSALLPACAMYRAMLALLVVRRLRDNTNRHAPANPKK
jgi:undecaprenyl-diphosphatase